MFIVIQISQIQNNFLVCFVLFTRKCHTFYRINTSNANNYTERAFKLLTCQTILYLLIHRSTVSPSACFMLSVAVHHECAFMQQNTNHKTNLIHKTKSTYLKIHIWIIPICNRHLKNAGPLATGLPQTQLREIWIKIKELYARKLIWRCHL